MLGSKFSSDPLIPPPHPLIIVISGPSGVGKDAVIKVSSLSACVWSACFFNNFIGTSELPGTVMIVAKPVL